MRILLVGNYALDNQASMLRYQEMLRRSLALRGHQVETVQPSAFFGKLVNQPTLRKWLGYIDKYIRFPIELRSRAQGFDVVHVCDHSNSMYLAHAGGLPASITCHDLLAIRAAQGVYREQKISISGRIQQRWILKHLAGARHVVCVSANTATELAGLRGDAVRGVVIPNALSPECQAAKEEDVLSLRARVGLAADERYLFHVGGNQWYKNRLGVLRIYRGLLEGLGDGGRTLRLVMAGAKFSNEMREFAGANLAEGKAIEVVNPSDDEIWRLYTGATALLFPSLHEGFGWPLIEAQRCGCPVISSNRLPMTEVAGAAAVYIDPEDELGAATTIAENLGRLGELRQAGFENVRRFDADRIASAYEDFFAGVAKAGGEQPLP
jgi:glycosyltransferase involved in cell wall biosynthesis